MKRLLFAVLAGTLLAVAMAGVAESGLPTCFDATCKILTPDGGPAGTGSVVDIDSTTVYVLTNAHVVGNRQTMTCEFYWAGHRSLPLTGRVLDRQRQKQPIVDIACIGVPASAFGDKLPACVPLSTGPLPQAGDTITSVGASGGSWPTAFAGHVLGYSEADGSMIFVPCPAPGRSGSAIYNADSTAVVGLLFGKDPEVLRDGSPGNRYGFAMPLAHLRRVLCSAKQREAGDAIPFRLLGPSDCQSGGCPNGQCPLPQDKQQDSPWRLLPYRHDQDEQIQQLQKPVPPAGGVWPSRPQQQAPPVDLSGVNASIADLRTAVEANTARLAPLEATADKARQLSDQWPALQAALQNLEQTSTTTTEQARQAATDASKAVDAVTGVAGKAAEAVAAANDTKAEVDAALDEDAPNGLLGKLKGRVDERIAGLEEKFGSLIVGKLAAKAGISVPVALGGLAGLALLGFLFIRSEVKRVEAGEPTRWQEFATKTPMAWDDKLADRGAAGLGKLAEHQAATAEHLASLGGIVAKIATKVKV